ncbi:MAG: head-tail joining protein [Stenotrophomonas sp.]
MSQKAFLRQFDASAIQAFAATGMADAAAYTPKAGGAAIDCNVMVDRAVQQWGDDPMPLAAGDITVTFQRAQVVPEKGGMLVVDGDTYRLADKLFDDGSLIRYAVVAHG